MTAYVNKLTINKHFNQPFLTTLPISVLQVDILYFIWLWEKLSYNIYIYIYIGIDNIP
jgi:hypothetical protein